MRAQLVDLRFRLLEALLQLAGLVLHLGVGGEQELDDDADLVGGGELRQVLARLRQRDGVALAGVEIGTHQIEDGGRFAVELQGRGLERRLRHGGRGGCRRVLPQGQPDDDAKADQAEGREADQPGLDRRETRGEHRVTRIRPAREPRTHLAGARR